MPIPIKSVFSGGVPVALGEFGAGEVVPLLYGGTGLAAANANAALNALLPSQTSNTGKVLVTDGTNTSWSYGGLVQRVEATPYTSYSSITTTIPNDDTIPQNTEGAQILSVSITPKSATNRLVIDALCIVSADAQRAIATALFQDSGANAIKATSQTVPNTGFMVLTQIHHEMAAGTTSATTFTIRVGPGGGTLYVNGNNTTRLMGGANACSLSVTEVKP